MVDVSWASSPAVHRNMQANRRRDTSPELAVRRLLFAMGLRYRVDWPLPVDRRRRADIAFTRARLAIFIDGCFWHGCPEHYVAPKTHPEYWREKIVINSARDRDTDENLAAAGWQSLRFWEHEPTGPVAAVVAEAYLRRLAAEVARPGRASPES